MPSSQINSNGNSPKEMEGKDKKMEQQKEEECNEIIGLNGIIF